MITCGAHFPVLKPVERDKILCDGITSDAIDCYIPVSPERNSEPGFVFLNRDQRQIIDLETIVSIVEMR
jgi:hypothetical protein